MTGEQSVTGRLGLVEAVSSRQAFDRNRSRSVRGPSVLATFGSAGRQPPV